MSKKVSTGINGLDEMIGGGFPEGRVVLIVGGPGSGKTIMCSQFLYHGINEKQNGVFVSLDESKKHYFSEMKNFGWDFEKAEKEGKFAFVDATRMSRVAMLKEALYKEEASSLRGKALPIDRLIQDIQARMQQVNAKRIVVDTLAALVYRFPDPVERRTTMVDLIESLADLGATSLVTTELGHLGTTERAALEEEFLVHGVIMLQTLFSSGTTTRAMQVEKMRETKVNPSLVPYSIDKTGLEVFPNMPLFGEK